jgi:hypothetical protein
MSARKNLLGAAAALTFIPALALPASASNLPAGHVTRYGACRHTGTTSGWKKCQGTGGLELYISAPYQDNGVTVVSLWWTAPAGATTFSLTADENTADGTFDFTEPGLSQYTQSSPFIVQVEGDTTLNSATFQVTDNLGDSSNVVTYS